MSAVDETAQPLAVPTSSPRRWRRAVTAAVPVGAGLAAALLAANGRGSPARWVLVVLSAGLATSSAIPSIQAVRTDPASLQPLTWGIWAALTALAAVASAIADDWPSAIFSTVGTATCATVTIAVLRLGKHTFTARDAVCLALGIAGLIGWQIRQQPQLAVLAARGADLAALAPTIMHAWRRPHEEPTASFALIAAGGLCTAAAAWGSLDDHCLGLPALRGRLYRCRLAADSASTTRNWTQSNNRHTAQRFVNRPGRGASARQPDSPGWLA